MALLCELTAWAAAQEETEMERSENINRAVRRPFFRIVAATYGGNQGCASPTRGGVFNPRNRYLFF